MLTTHHPLLTSQAEIHDLEAQLREQVTLQLPSLALALPLCPLSLTLAPPRPAPSPHPKQPILL